MYIYSKHQYNWNINTLFLLNVFALINQIFSKKMLSENIQNQFLISNIFDPDDSIIIYGKLGHWNIQVSKFFHWTVFQLN